MTFLLNDLHADINFDLNQYRSPKDRYYYDTNNGICQVFIEDEKYNSQLLDFMLDNCANINDVDHSNHCPALAWACKRGDIKVVNKFLKHPATEGNTLNINAPYIDGKVMPPRNNDGTINKYGTCYIRTALMAASKSGHLDIVSRLLEHDASVDLIDHKGRTAFMFACMKGHADIAERLLAYKANINLQDNQGKTALMFAVDNNCTDVVDRLLERNTHGENIAGMRNRLGQTPLMIACCQNDIDSVKLLLAETKIDINFFISGRTYPALIYACESNNAEMVTNILCINC